MLGAVHKVELQSHRRRPAPPLSERSAQRLEHPGEQERERLEAVHRPVQLELHLEALRRRPGDERRVVLASREAMQPGPFGPQALGQSSRGELLQVSEPLETPAPEQLEVLG